MTALPFESFGIGFLALALAASCGGTVGSRGDGGTAHPDGGGGDGGDLPDGAPGTPDATPANVTTMVYVGGGDSKIHAYVLDRDTLALTPAGTTNAGNGPSFLAFDARARWLVAVNEGASMVQSFTIDASSGALTVRDSASSEGSGPAHIGLDRSGKYVLVANYDGGTAAVLPISDAGDFGTPTAMVAPGMNAHQIIADATNTNLYVPCLGSDHIAHYAFDAAHGTVVAKPVTNSPDGAGPRHIALTPDGKFAYVMNELDSTISSFKVGADGTLTVLGAATTTLPVGFSGNNTGAEIAVHPNGKFLYSSNRGHDSIASFAIAADGHLTALGHTPTGGKDPRHFSLALGGSALFAANQTGNSVFGFHVNATTGALTGVGKIADVPGPEFVGALDLPAP
jgi:6-phosphogluconolactonase